MKGKTIRWLILAAAVLCAGIFAAVRTRPLGQEARYPELETALNQCTEIRVRYETGNDRETREQISFTIPREDPRFDALLTGVRSGVFRRTLFPRPQVRYASPEEGDHQWELGFYAPVPGREQGNLVLALENFYGELELWVSGSDETLECTAEDAWLREMWAAMQEAPAL